MIKLTRDEVVEDIASEVLDQLGSVLHATISQLTERLEMVKAAAGRDRNDVRKPTEDDLRLAREASREAVIKVSLAIRDIASAIVADNALDFDSEQLEHGAAALARSQFLGVPKDSCVES